MDAINKLSVAELQVNRLTQENRVLSDNERRLLKERETEKKEKHGQVSSDNSSPFDMIISRLWLEVECKPTKNRTTALAGILVENYLVGTHY